MVEALEEEGEEEEDEPLPQQRHLQAVRGPTPPRANPYPEESLQAQLAALAAMGEEEGAGAGAEEEEDDDLLGAAAPGWEQREQPPPPPQPMPMPAQAQAPPGARVQGGNGNHINNNVNNNENDADVELQVAVDELLGVRGPFPFLIRNILWLLAFNGAYLGLFAFIPYRSVLSLGAWSMYLDRPSFCPVHPSTHNPQTTAWAPPSWAPRKSTQAPRHSASSCGCSCPRPCASWRWRRAARRLRRTIRCSCPTWA